MKSVKNIPMNNLPKLRKISYKNKKHRYKIKDTFKKRKLAIHEGVNMEAKKTKEKPAASVVVSVSSLCLRCLVAVDVAREGVPRGAWPRSQHHGVQHPA